ncbi:hypothetical protein HNR19_002002 [Nocardioides thalensis]|uniref:DUF2975 domain-containing protein n=1 Tax=Nocardioides thalensis TaxID=1914755 RepID=A0A853C1W8_9ACTN|nr:hypothetical protein [Nocardioides thalensis]NYJ01304.1 hypothetical protein [Nocardioides thalensis]
MARRFNPSTFFARGLLGVVVLSGAVGLVLAVYNIVTRGTVGRDVEIGPKREYGGDAVSVAEGAWVRWRYDGNAGLDDPSVGLVLINELPNLLLGGALLTAAWAVFLVVIDVELRLPFRSTSVRNLRVAAVAVASAAVLHPVLSTVADLGVFHAAAVGESGHPRILLVGAWFENIPWFLVAALLAAFGQAFGEGRRLAHDTEGLV